jgi:prepilin peptidase CpaA
MNETAALLDLLATLVGDPRNIALLSLVTVAAVIDYRTYRIPNWLTAGGTVFALLLHANGAGHTSLASAGLGLLIGFLAMLPLYALRVLGAGDVKLMAMTGAFLGAGEIVPAVLATCIVGGVAACCWALARRSLGRMLGNVRAITQGLMWNAIGGTRLDATVKPGESVGRLPYGVSIAAGTTLAVAGRHFGLF